MRETFLFGQKKKVPETELNARRESFFLKALDNLVGSGNYSLVGDDVYENITNWKVDNPPTESEVMAEFERIKTEFETTVYARYRSNEYPAITEQLDALWHAMDNGVLPKVDGFYDAVKTIKDKYPKL